jgi:hypothetical protein
MRLLTFAALLASAALGQDLTRTYQLKNTSPSGMREIATTLRTVFEVKTLSIDPTVSTLTVTGNPDQIALAEWLIPKLDVLPGTTPTPQKYLYAGNNNDVVEIYALKNAPVITDLQEVLTGLRTVVQIEKIYQLSPRLLSMRGNPSQIQMAEWLIPQLDKQTATGSGAELRAPTGNDDVLHVFNLVDGTNVGDALKTVRQLNVPKAYIRTSLPALAARGTADQIALVATSLPVKQ